MSGCAELAEMGERVAHLESKEESHQSQLDRIEGKLDGLSRWILGTVLSVAAGAIGTLVMLLTRRIP